MTDELSSLAVHDAQIPALFNPEHLGEIMGMTEAPALAEFYSIFLQQTELLAAQLGEFGAAGDLRALERLAHKFKSSSGFIGAEPLAQRLEQLEGLCRSGELESEPGLLDSTVRLTQRSLQEIAAWRDQLLQRS